MQEVVEPQETPASLATFAPLGFGTELSDHSLPFQCSATGLLAASPTDMQEVEELHETLNIAFSPLPSVGLGAIWSDHEVPFQRSTKGLYPVSLW